MNSFSRNKTLCVSVFLAAAATACFYWMSENTNTPDQASSFNAVAKSDNTKIEAGLPLHPVVDKVVNEGVNMSYLKFTFLIKTLPLDLAEHDIDALIDFISADRPLKFSETQWGSLVNDIEECLTVQTVPSHKVADALIAIFRDESKIQLQRDYAIQHLGGFAIYIIHTERSRAVKSPLFQLILSELKVAASQASRPWSGTAINLLDGVLRAADYRSVSIPELSADTLIALSLPIMSDESAPLNARLPALQAATRRGSPEARTLALKILSSPDSSLMLVQSAAATLAQMGNAGDLAVLKAASSRSNRHTSLALSEAIRSIETKYIQN